MAEGQQYLQAINAEIFVSYSRKDKEFAGTLSRALQESGRTTWLDEKSVQPTEEWLKAIYSGIEASDYFLFIISPDSVSSETCKNEVRHALANRKRIVPVLHRAVERGSLPDILAREWIDFSDDTNFDNTFRALVRVLDTDLDHVRLHTRLLMRSIQWDLGGQDASLLLRGHELQEAEQWLIAATAKGSPEPTPLQSQYITRSRQESTKRQRLLFAAVLCAFVVATSLAVLYWWQRGIAIYQAQVALSRQLAAQASNSLDEAYDLALLLSVEAYGLSDTVDVRSSLFNAARYSPRLVRYLYERGEINALAVSPDDRLLASGSDSGGITLWNLTQEPPAPRVLRSPSDRETRASINDVAFSRDGTILGAAIDDKITLWDITTGQELPLSFVGHQDIITSIAFSSDGKSMATGSYDDSVILWDYRAAKLVDKLSSNHLGRVRSVAFSPDGKLLAAGGDSPMDTEGPSEIILWDVPGREPIGEPLLGHKNSVRRLVFSHDGKRLASGSYDETAILWDVTSHNLIGHPLAKHSGTVFSLAFNPDDTMLVTGGYDQKVILWDIDEQDPTEVLSGHRDRVFSIAVTNDGRKIASGDGSGAIVLWNPSGAPPFASPIVAPSKIAERAYEVAYSPDGRMLATTGSNNAVYLWDVKARHLIEPPLEGHKDWVFGVAFSQDGSMLASTSADRSVIIWDVHKHSPVGPKLIGHSSQVLCVAFSPDDKLLASGGMDGSVILWNVSSHKPVGQSIRLDGADPPWVMTIAFSPDGRMLAVGSKDGKVYIWDLATRRLAMAPLVGHHQEVTKVSFSPDAKFLASSSFDDTVIVWDLATGHAFGGVLVGDKSKAPIYNVVFSPDGQTLATSSMNGNVALWDMVSRQRIGVPFTDKGSAIAFAPDGHTLAAAGGLHVYFIPLNSVDPVETSDAGQETGDNIRSPDGMAAVSSQDQTAISLLDVDPHSWMLSACRMANRKLTADEWKRYVGDVPYHPACGGD
jgi:WD40 repeat protein